MGSLDVRWSWLRAMPMALCLWRATRGAHVSVFAFVVVRSFAVELYADGSRSTRFFSELLCPLYGLLCSLSLSRFHFGLFPPFAPRGSRWNNPPVRHLPAIHCSQYLLVPNAKTALRYSTAATLLALFVFGWFKAMLIGSPKRGKSAVETLAVGGAAAAAAYFLAKLFPVDL